MPLVSGQVLQNRYRIEKELGRGGFGAVYKGWDVNLNRPCAIKENLDVSTEAQAQFLREAQMLADLAHPNLARVIDHFILPGQGQYLVMNFVEGEDLQEILRRDGALDQSRVLRWLDQVCDALVYLHSQEPPVIHRDIKPANIRINPRGQPVLVDFGIAKVMEDNTPTRTGARAVTPGYSPYEQYGTAPTDARSDIYALGATAYCLLSGNPPPEAIQRMADPSLGPPSAVKPGVSPGVDAAVLKALQIFPANRWQTVAQFKQALHAAAAAPATLQGAASPGPGVQQKSKASTAEKAAPPTKWLGKAALAVGVLAGLGLATWLVVGVLLPGLAPRTPAATAPAATPRVATVVTSSQPVQITVTPEFALTQMVTVPSITETPPEPLDDDTRVRSVDGMTQVFIPAGDFTLGRDSGDQIQQPARRVRLDGYWSDQIQKPAHRVYLDGYWIDQTEVTNAMYARCVADGACNQPTASGSMTREEYFGNPDFDDYPVIRVDWEQSDAYCRWAGGQLPSEAQWEKAARGSDDRTYPWGEGIDCSLANYLNCVSDTVAVGSYPQSASPYGVLDMAGNVQEWVADWFDPVYYGSQTTWRNPSGPSSGSSRVMRGGSWLAYEIFLETSQRSMHEPFQWYYDFGFRCVNTE